MFKFQNCLQIAAELRQIREAKTLREKFETMAESGETSRVVQDETLAELEQIKNTAASTREKFRTLEKAPQEGIQVYICYGDTLAAVL